MHGAVADVPGGANSGPVAEGHVRPTLEVFPTELDGELRRMRDDAIGLDMLALGQPGPRR